MADTSRVPCIYVLAGTNGAGRSSVAGATFLEMGTEYFNPDAAAEEILRRNQGIDRREANSSAWYEGKRLLQRAIDQRLTYAFETTLAGSTISSLLEQALAAGIEVRIWYAGLSSPELHIARVRARVRKGGHDIPEATIRDRYDTSRLNLVRLLSKVTELRAYDNSEERDPDAGLAPTPKLVLHVEQGRIVDSCDLALTPEWAKPILAAAMKLGP